MLQLVRDQGKALLGLLALGDIAEIANDTVAPFRKPDATDLPFVVLDDTTVATFFAAIRSNKRFTRGKRVAETLDDLIRVRLMP